MYVILNGYVLSYARFDWLVGSMSVYQENLFLKKVKKQQFPSFVDFFFEKYFGKQWRTFFGIYIAS